jgi:7-cyano-7-deazaguanine synthase
MTRDKGPETSTAVLISGGLDSAILLAELLRAGGEVHPLYVRGGHGWEDVEREHLGRFLRAVATPRLHSLVILEMPVEDMLTGHWSLTGRGVPGADSPDEAVFLPGRNVLLLAKAMIWCHRRGVATVALATLKGNPFPDATRGFFRDFEAAVNRGIGGTVAIQRPFGMLEKVEVLRLGSGLPLDRTFSCIRPVDGRHCGSCNKCAERRRAFLDAGLVDPTNYQVDSVA